VRPGRLSAARGGEATPAQARAAEHLGYIRDTLARASSFTAVSGTGQVAVGILALAAAPLAMVQESAVRWVSVWLATAVVAVAVSVWAHWRKARRLDLPIWTPAGRRFLWVFTLPLVSGAILTAAIIRGDAYSLLPGIWLLLFGTAVAAGGIVSVRPVSVMGVLFMAIGTLALLAPAWGDACMAAGFGGVNIACGAVIARRHGG
jgi:hypothetical protein